MFNISQLLERYRNFTPTEAVVKDAVLEAIKDATGITLKREDCTVRGFTFTIKTSPKIKGEVFMKRVQILKVLEEKLKQRAPRDLR